MDTLLQDVRIGIRRLFRSRGFAAMAIGTLAIGIGANTAVFTLINAVQLRPLPFTAPERLVDLFEHNPDPAVLCTGCGVGTSYANFLDWQRAARSFSSMAAHDEAFASVGLTEGAQKQRVARVSAELFPMLGVAPVRGRFFTRDEEQSRGARVALIGYALALASFGADANPVGQTMRVDGEVFEIIGVMPERFVFPEHADLWLPLAQAAHSSERNERTIGVVARLDANVTREQAATEMQAIGTQMAAQFPVEQKGWSAHLISLHEDLASDYTEQSALLLGAVTCVLLIACANLANLMLARATSRRTELAVRAALGATRMQLARQFLVETMLISLAGGALGLIVSMWGVDFLRAVGSGIMPQWIVFETDWRVFGYALGVSLLTGLAFGVLPARLAARANVNDVMKDGGRSSTGGRRTGRTRDVLVVSQVAVALVLVIAAGLLTKTMLRSRTFDMGYEIANLIRADIGTTGPRYENGPTIAAFADRVLSEMERSRDVKSVALSGTHFHNWPGTPPQVVTIDDVPAERSATALHRMRAVSVRYFETIGLSLMSGRGFIATDVAGNAPVAVISQTLARTLWGEKPAVGKHIRIGPVEWTVVGVVSDMRESPLGTGASPMLFVPLSQHPVQQPQGQPLSLHVRTIPDAIGVTQLIRAAVREVDPDVTADGVATVEAHLRQWQSPVRILAMMAAALGVFACLLASIGIYGVISYLVAQRTHEIGIRMALGATIPEVLQMVMRHGLKLGFTGTAIGLVGSAAITRILGYRLFGLSPRDPAVYALVGAGFLLVALLAAYLPARTATRVDPTEALRTD